MAEVYLNVADYNIDNSGQNDTSTLINNLINQNPGKTLFFPAGEYLITKPIVIKSFTRLIGENLRTTRIFNTNDFEGHSMIQNFTGLKDPSNNDNTSYYNNIENLFIENNSYNENLVMIWLIHLWEGSYVKNIHFKNNGLIKGGLWHTVNKSAEGGGGQFVIENINAFYGEGICREENIKLINSGGLYCRNWNINNFKLPKNPTHPIVSLEVATLVLSVKEIHIEITPGNDLPSLRLTGHSCTVISLKDSDIDSSIRHDSSDLIIKPTVGIELNLLDEPELIDWDIDNVNLKNGTGGRIWNNFFDYPIRIISNSKVENIANDNINNKISIIRKFTKSIRAFNNMPGDQYRNVLGINEGLVYQLSIGTLLESQSKNINLIHFLNRKFKRNIVDYGSINTGNYEAKAFQILISGLDSHGQVLGGMFLLFTAAAHLSTTPPNHIIQTVYKHGEFELNIANNNLKIKNTSMQKVYSRLNLIIIGTGTTNE